MAITSAVVAGVTAVAEAASVAAPYVALASAAASGSMAYSSSEAQKEQQKAYNNQLQEEAIRQYKEIDEAEADAIYESHAESLQSQREFLQARSSILLQSAVTGTYGSSVDVALHDLDVGLGQRMTEITYRRDAQLNQLTSAAEQIQAGAAASLDRAISAPSWYQAGATSLSTFQRTYGAVEKAGETAKQMRRV